MSDVTYASQGLSAETISSNGGQILKRFELGCREAFAEDWQVILL